MKKKSALALGNLVFLFPVLLLSFFMWKDYMSHIDVSTPTLDRVYLLDEGKKLIGFSNGD